MFVRKNTFAHIRGQGMLRCLFILFYSLLGADSFKRWSFSGKLTGSNIQHDVTVSTYIHFGCREMGFPLISFSIPPFRCKITQSAPTQGSTDVINGAGAKIRQMLGFLVSLYIRLNVHIFVPKLGMKWNFPTS